MILGASGAPRMSPVPAGSALPWLQLFRFMEMPSADSAGIWEVPCPAPRPLEVFYVPLKEKHPKTLGIFILRLHRDTARWQWACVHMRGL